MSKDKTVSPTEEEVKLDQQTETSSTSEQKDTETSGESSTSGKSESELSTLDLVKNAISETSKDNDKTEGSSDKGESKEEAESKDKAETEDTDESDDATEEELKAWKKELNAKTAKRFEQLQAKYRDASERLERAEVDAGFKVQFENFLQSNRMTQEEANTLFDIGALMKSNPNKALEMLTPYYNQLLEVTGHILPVDLKQQIEQGYITEHNALELSRQRALNRNHQVMTEQQEADQRQQEVVNQQKLNGDIQIALARLENGWQTSDPDYAMKSTRVQERVKLMWYEASRTNAMPRSVEDAIAKVNKVKQEVEKEFRQFMPKKSVNTVDGGSASSVKAAPTNTLDLIRQTVGA